MTKSTTVVFILGFAILFKLEKKVPVSSILRKLIKPFIFLLQSWSLCITVSMICVGLILFTYKATEFNVLGFILLLVASMSSGLRWTCVQLLLQNCKANMRNPVDMIYHMQPWMIVSLLPFVIWIEGTFFYLNQNCCTSFFSENFRIICNNKLHSVQI